jgi:SAM-dependent methyltransferase
MIDKTLTGNAFYQQFQVPINNVSLNEMDHVFNLYNAYMNKPVNSVIDFGCGTGASTHCLRVLYPKATIVGLDMCQAALDIAIKYFGSDNIEWICNDIRKDPMGIIGNVDMFFAMGHSWKNLSWIIPIARQLAGGMILFTTTSWTEPYNMREPKMIEYLLDPKYRSDTFELVIKEKPKYVEFDSYKIYAVY